VTTSVEPLDRFWLAEEYHQTYHWKQWVRTLPREVQADPPGPASTEFCEWLTRDRFWRDALTGVLDR
jgi:hypothetical protein